MTISLPPAYFWVAAINGSLIEATKVASGAVGIGPELVVNGSFAADTNWTKGTGWTIAAGVASRTNVGATSDITQAQTLPAGSIYRLTVDVTARVSGSVTPRFTGGTGVNGTPRNAVGSYTENITASGTGNTTLSFNGSPTFDGAIDNASLRRIA